MNYSIEVVKLPVIENVNLIIGRSHFIKTVEDLYEAIVETNPNIKFGIAFSEASGKRLIRVEGNDEEMKKLASETAMKISAGHCFYIYLKNGFPVNILNKIKNVSEVVDVIAATANPLEVIIIKTLQGRGIIGVIDGESPLGIENENDKKERQAFLRNIGYKR